MPFDSMQHSHLQLHQQPQVVDQHTQKKHLLLDSQPITYNSPTLHLHTLDQRHSSEAVDTTDMMQLTTPTSQVHPSHLSPRSKLAMLRVDTHHQQQQQHQSAAGESIIKQEYQPHHLQPHQYIPSSHQHSITSPTNASSSASSSVSSPSSRQVMSIVSRQLGVQTPLTHSNSYSPTSSILSRSSATPLPQRHSSTSSTHSTSSASSGASSTISSVDSSPALNYRIMAGFQPSVLSVCQLSGEDSATARTHQSDSSQSSDEMQMSTPQQTHVVEIQPITQQSEPMQVTEPARLSKKRSHDEVMSAGSIISTPAEVKEETGGDAIMKTSEEIVAGTSSNGVKSEPSSSNNGTTSETPKQSGVRYKPIRTLQNSLFGQVQLAFDNVRGVPVAVKVSHSALVNPKSHIAGSSSRNDPSATARSQAGVSVLEDVRREARILKLLLGADQTPITAKTIDARTCGLSTALVMAINLPANATPDPASSNPLSIQQQFLDSISKGKRCIAAFYDEVEAESFHYLISEYVAGGDLFSVLTQQPQHKVTELIARQWMYQLCCSVRYLHAHSIAHLDLSLENICMDDKGAVRLIDFGLAAQHPGYSGDKASVDKDGKPVRNASHHVKLLTDPVAQSSCDCHACTISSEELLTSDPAILAAKAAGVPLAKLRYLCRPVCERVHKPGKLGYMAAELYANQCWDSFKHDMFGIGVILYSMLTGRPPFTRPDPESDVWFKVIYSGQWLSPQVRSQAPAAIYSGLSQNALNLIDLLISPQHTRPTIDAVMKHPWFTSSHPGSATTAVPSSRIYSDTNATRNGKTARAGSQ